MILRIASLLLFTVCCLALAVAPVMADTLYSNGPYNGTTDAWTINFGFSVSDSFTVPGNSTITGLDFVYWDASSTDLLTTTDLAFGTTSFGSDLGTRTGVAFTSTFLGANQFGYNLYEASGTIVGEGCPRGVLCYVTLSNACTTGGCSENPIYWDENSGPSTAYENSVGSIPSEAFTLTGTSSGTTPEPSSIMLFGSGILGLAVILRRRLMG
jgi:hypothetical protein